MPCPRFGHLVLGQRHILHGNDLRTRQVLTGLASSQDLAMNDRFQHAVVGVQGPYARIDSTADRTVDQRTVLHI